MNSITQCSHITHSKKPGHVGVCVIRGYFAIWLFFYPFKPKFLTSTLSSMNFGKSIVKNRKVSTKSKTELQTVDSDETAH